MPKKPKIIIIGANGMLGQALFTNFKKSNKYEILAWDKDELDIGDEKSVNKKILAESPFLIINSAAHNAVDQIEADKKIYALAKKINSDGPKYLAIVAKKSGAILVHYVSDYIFDGEKAFYLETDAPQPISRYGETKLAGEKNVKKNLQKYYIIRTSKLFGTPAKSQKAKKSFFASMLDLAQKNTTLTVVNEELSCFTYVNDLAQATRKLIEKKFPFGIYHLVNEGAETWYSALKKILKINKLTNIRLLPVPASNFPRPAKRPKCSVLKNNKFPKLRNWEDAAKDWLKNG
jgi:dTDP-4-dehydrorhamnose reductase